MNEDMLNKYEKLKKLISSYESIAIAFSSGVDSTFLLYAAKDALGKNVLAITAASYSFPERELIEAKEYCEKLGISHSIVKTNELSNEEYVKNPKNRCYICKKEIFNLIIEEAAKQNISTVAEGSNLDDEGDYRPGLMAVKELQVKSPLREVGLTKSEIRQLSKHFNVPTFDKPSFACLATRIPYGEIITKEKLKMIENSEQLLLKMGFKQFRVRAHGNVARIELEPKDFDVFMKEEVRTKVNESFKSFGFTYVSLDIMGYRTGSMNEIL